MPQIGEMKRGHQLGYRCNNPFFWHTCPDCGKERWVWARSLLKSQNVSKTRCKPCENLVRGRSLASQCVGGAKHPPWKGGRVQTGTGYILVYVSPDEFFYPMTQSARNYVLEHRLIMAKSLGRCLHIWELVHHRNGIKDDNRIENLMLVSDMGHKQITCLECRIKHLEGRVTLLEAENILLKEKQYDYWCVASKDRTP